MTLRVAKNYCTAHMRTQGRSKLHRSRGGLNACVYVLCLRVRHKASFSDSALWACALCLTKAPSAAQVAVEIWHDSDDSCGSRCTRTSELLSELSAKLGLEEAGTWQRLTVRPRLAFSKLDAPCTDEWFCATRCVNNRCARARAHSVGLRGRCVAACVT